MKLDGYYFSKGASLRRPASLAIEGRHFTLRVVDDVDSEQTGLCESLKVSVRLANVERKVLLSDGTVFTTVDNDGVDQAFITNNSVSQFLHRIESHLAWVVIALVVTLVSAYGFINWGVPWSSEKIANMLPHQTNERLAQQSFAFLDEYILEPSHINEEKQTLLKNHFQQNLIEKLFEDGEEIDYRLHFRRWGEGEDAIPNALALPSGDIIVTDKFVELAVSQDEIDAILLHEIGHVTERHSLQMLVQTTVLATVIMMITGDAGSVADMGIGLGSMLVQSHYSRRHETQADIYALQRMLELNVDPSAFSTIMTKLDSFSQQKEESSMEEAEGWLDYLSTHPASEQRILNANHYSQCFHKGLRNCERPFVE